MMRCQSWRPVPLEDTEAKQHASHRAGECHRCWRPCRNTVTGEGRRCDECLRLLIAHPSEHVRLALASEDDLPTEALEALSTDGALSVRTEARARLGNRAPVSHQMVVTADSDGWGDEDDTPLFTPPVTGSTRHDSLDKASWDAWEKVDTDDVAGESRMVPENEHGDDWDVAPTEALAPVENSRRADAVEDDYDDIEWE